MKRLIPFVTFLCSMNTNAQTYNYDVNGDGNVDIVDITNLTNHILGKQNSGEPEYVDLGLSVKWAKCNIGSTSPEAFGLYFAWGETKGYTSSAGHKFNWGNYAFCYELSYEAYDSETRTSSAVTKTIQTKYCTDSDEGKVDNKIVLDDCDDAAHVYWGGSWRMPTDEEFSELKKACKWIWTSSNGVAGYKVLADNGNYIFLPAAGICSDATIDNVGEFGYYWSSSLLADYPTYACCLNFGSSGPNKLEGDDYRFYGHCIRAVCP